MLDRKSDEMSREKKSFEYYEIIREAIKGLTEILKIKFKPEDFFYQAGLDNLNALHASILALLEQYNSPTEIQQKLAEIEFRERSIREKNR